MKKMWQQFSRVWIKWHSFFDDAMEVINPEVLEGNGEVDSFFLDFTRKVQQIYSFSPLGKVNSVTAELDSPDNWLIIQFNIVHNRQRDEIGIRWSGNEITVDFLPGGTTTNSVCFIDDHGLRWVMLDCSKTCLIPTKNEKKDIERIITGIYATSRHYKPQLKFIIGHSAKVRTKEKKL